MTAREQLEELDRIITELLKPAELAAKNPNGPRQIDIVVRRMVEWQSVGDPPKGDTRGGSTSPAVAEERSEDRAVSRMAVHAQSSLPQMLTDLTKMVHQLERLCGRFLHTVDASKLPADSADRCVNCIQADHFAPVYPKAPGSGLCRWCYDHKRVEGSLPPVEACRLYHEEGPTPAGRWLAARSKVAS